MPLTIMEMNKVKEGDCSILFIPDNLEMKGNTFSLHHAHSGRDGGGYISTTTYVDVPEGTLHFIQELHNAIDGELSRTAFGIGWLTAGDIVTYKRRGYRTGRYLKSVGLFPTDD